MRSDSRCLFGAICATVAVLSAGTAAGQTTSWANATLGNYTTAALWTNGVPNGATFDGIIAATGANYTVTLSTSVSVNSLTINSANATLSQTGGTLTLGAGGLNLQAGAYVLGVGGTISGGAITSSGGVLRTGSGINPSPTLSGVNVGVGVVDLGAVGNDLVLTNGTTFANGTVLTFNANSGNSGDNANLEYAQTGTLAGVTVSLGNNAALRVGGSGNTLTIGATSTVTVNAGGGYGSFLTGRYLTAGTGTNAIVNQGVIESPASGRSLYVDIPSFTNAPGGVVRATGGGVYLRQPFTNQGTLVSDGGLLAIQTPATTAQLGTFSATNGGVVRIDSTLDNTAATLALTASTGSLTLNVNGTITGGTVTAGGGAALRTGSGINPSPTLSGVTLGVNALDLSAIGNDVVLTNGTTLAPGSTVTFNGNTGNSGDNANLEYAQTGTVSGVTVSLGNNAALRVGGSGNTLTIGATSTVTVNAGGGYGSFLTGRSLTAGTGTNAIVNQGVIESPASGRSLYVDVPSFTNAAGGVVRAAGGGVYLRQPFTNQGTLVSDGGLLAIQTPATTAQLGTFSATNGGVVRIDSTLDNTAATLALTASTGSLTLNVNGTITGGTITASGGAALLTGSGISPSPTLSGVTLGVNALDLGRVGNDVVFTNGTTLASGTAITFNGNTGNSGDNANLEYAQTGTVDGVTISLGNNAALRVGGSSNTLTLGPATTVTVNAAGGFGSFLTGRYLTTGTGTNAIVNQGTIESPASGRSLYIDVPSFTNAAGGVVRASGGGVYLRQPFTNQGTLVADAGLIAVQTPATTAQLGAFAATNGGLIRLDSTLDNTAATVALTAATGGLTLFRTATITGGSVTSDGSAAAVLRFDANNSTAAASLVGVAVGANVLDLNYASGFGRVVLSGGSTLAPGPVTVRNGLIGFNQTGTVDGVAFTLAGNGYLTAEGANTLTLGPATTVAATTGTNYLASNSQAAGAGSILNQGGITASGGSYLQITPSGTFTNVGTLVSTGANTGVVIRPSGAFANIGTISATSNAYIFIDRNLTTAQLSGFSSSGGGRILLNDGRTLDNTGTTLALTSNTGALTLYRTAVITGGAVTSDGSTAAVLRFDADNTTTYGQLVGVAVGANALDLNYASGFGRVSLSGGSTLAPGPVTVRNADFAVNQTATVDGVALTLAGNGYVSALGGNTLTLGPATTVTATANTNYLEAVGSLVNQGAVTVTGGSYLPITASGTFTNAGTLSATGTNSGVVIRPTGAFTNTGTLSATAGGYIFVDRDLTTAQLGAFTSSGGGRIFLNDARTLDNTGATLALTAATGALTLYRSATIAGGSITSDGNSAAVLRFDADNSTIAGRLVGVAVGVNVLDLNYASGFGRAVLSGGSTLAAGSALTVRNALLGFNQTGTADGIAVTLATNGYLTAEGGNTLTLGPATTVAATANTNYLSGTGSVVSQGGLTSSGGGSFRVEPTGSFTNAGSLTATGTNSGVFVNPTGAFANIGTLSATGGGYVSINRDLTTAQLGSFNSSSGGHIYLIDGHTLDNTGATLALTSATGALTLYRAATITGGSVTSDGSASAALRFDADNSSAYGRLVGVAVGANALDLNYASGFGRVYLSGGSTLAAGPVTIRNGQVGFNQTGTVNGVAFTLAGNAYLTAEGNNTLTLGPATTVSATVNTNYLTGITLTGNVVNQGAVTSSGGGSLRIEPPGSFTNAGTLTATGSNSGVFVNPTGAFANTGTLIATAGGYITLNRNSTTAQLGTFSAAAGSFVYLNDGRTLDNTGATLALTAATGALTLYRTATITGGAVTSDGSANGRLRVDAGNSSAYAILAGVAVGANALDLNYTSGFGRVYLSGGSTLAAGPVAIQNAQLAFNQTYTADGSAITLAGNGYLSTEGGSVLTLGPATTVTNTNNTNYLTGITGTGSVVNNGTIQATAGFLQINPPGGFTNNGTLRAAGGSIAVTSATPFTNFSGSTLTGGTYFVGANSSLDFGTRTITTLAAGTSVTLSGSGATFNSLDGKLQTIGTGASFTVTGGRNYTAANAANSFTTNGTLTVGAGSTLTVPAGITYTNFSGGTLTGGTYSIAGTLNLGGRTVTGLAGGATIEFSGAASSTGLATLTNIPAGTGVRLVNNQTFTLSGSLSNAGNLEVQTGSTLNLVSLTNTGTITGGGTIATSANSTFTGGTYTSTGTVAVGGTLTVTAPTTLATGTYTSTGTLTLSAPLTVSAAATVGGSGPLVVPATQTLIVDGTTAAAKPVSVTGTLTGGGTVNGTVTANAGATLTGTGAGLVLTNTLAVAGNSTLTAGTVAVAGATTVQSGATFRLKPGTTLGGTGGVTVQSGGTFALSNTLAAAFAPKPITVQGTSATNYGVLAGNGTVGALVVQPFGRLAPGNSAGTVTVTGDIDLGGLYDWELVGNDNDQTFAGTGFDKVTGGGTGVVSAAAKVGVRLGGAVNFANPFWTQARSWTVLSTTGPLAAPANPVPVAVSGVDFTTNYPQGGFATLTDGNNLFVTWTPVPEPTGVLIVGLAAAAGWRFRRTRTPPRRATP